MTDTTALTTEIKSGSIAIRNVDEALRLGEIFYKSGFFSDVKSASQAIVKMLAGAELGFGPIASMSGVYVQNGRTAFMANLIASAIKRSGYDYKVETLTNEQCVLVFVGKDGKEIGESVFTMDDAKIATLDTGKNAHSWKHFPRNMLFARALTNGARWFTPEIFGGVSPYTPDELDMVVDGETGEVIEGVPETPMTTPESGSGKSTVVKTTVPSAEDLATLEKQKSVALKSTPTESARTIEFMAHQLVADEPVGQANVARFNAQYVGTYSQKGSLEVEGKFQPNHLTQHLKKHFKKAKLPDLTNEEFVALVKYVWLTLGKEGGGLTEPWYSDRIKEAVGEAPSGDVMAEAQEEPYAITYEMLCGVWYGPEDSPAFPGNNPNLEDVSVGKFGKRTSDINETERGMLYRLALAVKGGVAKVETVEDAIKELNL